MEHWGMEWESCMEMYVDVPDMTRCWFFEDEEDCFAVGTYMDTTLFGTCEYMMNVVETGDFTPEETGDDCVVVEQGSCLEEDGVAEIADLCHFVTFYDVCMDEEISCHAIVSVDGTDYIDTCEHLQMMLLPETIDETTEETEETTEETEETTEENTEADEGTEADEISVESFAKTARLHP